MGLVTAVNANKDRIVLGIVFLAIWQWVSGRLIDSFWISSPSQVAGYINFLMTRGAAAYDGPLTFHLWVTFYEAMLGFTIGFAIGAASGFILGRSPRIYKIFEPYLLLIISIPRIAIAPVLILFFGIGSLPKVVLAAIVAFVYSLFNIYMGMVNADWETATVLRIMGATKLEILKKVEFPAIVPWVINAAKISVPRTLFAVLSVEYLGSFAGLGYLLVVSLGAASVGMILAIVAAFLVISSTLYAAISVLEARLLRWRK
jgi:NitT/TauT family transport system permease protein